MSKMLEQPNVSEYMNMAHAFDSMQERDLEHWRQSAETRMSQLGGIAALARNPVHVKLILQQSIAANMLNDKFGKSYSVADFDEHGNGYMRQPEARDVAVKQRPLPSYVLAEDSEIENGMSL